jgi:hypothetical protein
MDAGQVAESSFVLLHADWPVERGLRFIETLNPSHVVVHRTEPEDYFYLYTATEALDLLRGGSDFPTIHQAADLHEWQSVPVVEAGEPVEALPDRCVVLEGGRPVGFFDVLEQLPGGNVVRGRTRGDSPTPGSVAIGETADQSLVADFPDRVSLDDVAWLLVSLSATAPLGAGIPVPLPQGESIDVLVQGKQGFVVEGQDRAKLSVASNEESLPIQFKLRATEPGPGSIAVLAFPNGQALGKIALSPTVEASASARSANEPLEVPRSHKDALAPISLRVPDLSMLIEERMSGGTREYMIRLTGSNPEHGLNLKQFGPLKLQMDPADFFGDFFEEIERLPITSPSDRAVAERKLAARGANFFQTLFPRDLQQQLWTLKDSIQSILIQSEEPWIPWELCRLVGEENGRTVEGPFLCEAYTVTRWMPGLGFKQPLSLNTIALVVPDDSGLALAPIERDYVVSLAGNSRRVDRIPAKFIDVQSALASGQYDGLHFTGHGGAVDDNPDRSAIYLEGQEPFTPEDLSGVATNLRQGRPLVFLNACQIGRGGMSLTGIGGWAKRFVDAGAGAFIGAYWSVYDQPAADFAKALYGNLFGGMTIGQAVRDARAQIRPAGDATWLAYTVLADPLATLS